MNNLSTFLQECRDIEAKATKGPWGYCYDGSSDYSLGRKEDPQVDRVCGFHDHHGKDYDRVKSDAEFIAFSRNNFMKLVECVEVLSKKLEGMAVSGCGECGYEWEARTALEKIEEILK